MKVLFTGGTGFVGRNVLPILKEKYEIDAPNRSKLDILDAEQVEEYVKRGHFDVIVQSANTNPVKSQADKDVNMVEGSLRCFMNFYRVRKFCGKLIYLGSGAELDKSKDMHIITEDAFDRSVPCDEYGFSKYIMNTLALQSGNVYNLRIFAVYGPTDHPSKFITHCIDSIHAGIPITIRQNCYFDYLQVFDFAKILGWFIENNPKYHDYNISSGQRYSLEDIAKTVRDEMNSDLPITILKEGLNREYTADNSRLLSEIGDINFTSLRDGIRIQIESQFQESKEE
jgi:nucleoside-diphosphate-sugar epimerase